MKDRDNGKSHISAMEKSDEYSDRNKSRNTIYLFILSFKSKLINSCLGSIFDCVFTPD